MLMLRRIDPMVRLLLAAMVLATLLPVQGAARDAAQAIANAAVFALFLLYGLKLSRADVLAGMRNLRLLGPLTLWVFGAMALAGWLLWQASLGWLPPALALGFLYLGVLPSTIQSATVYSSLAGGNVASSVVAAALINILGIFISAPLFSLLAGSHAAGLHGDALVKIITTLLLPFLAGQLLQGWIGHWLKDHRAAVTTLERGTIGIAVYVAFSGAVVQGLWQRVDAADWAALMGGCGALLVLGYGGSWLLGGMLRLSHGDRIAMVFAGAQKSVAMGAPLATVLFPAEAAGTVLLPLLTYHLAQMVAAAPIAARLRKYAPENVVIPASPL